MDEEDIRLANEIDGEICPWIEPILTEPLQLVVQRSMGKIDRKHWHLVHGRLYEIVGGMIGGLCAEYQKAHPPDEEEGKGWGD